MRAYEVRQEPQQGKEEAMREERAAVAGRMLALAIALALAKAMVDTMRELDQRLRGRRASNPYDSKRTHGQGALWWLRGPR